MEAQPKEVKSFLLPVKAKVILAFVFACVAIAMAVATTYLSFNRLLKKVDQLSAPNVKLKILSNLFEQISQLDQQQRADAIRNPQKPHREFLIENNSLASVLDTLIQLCKDDSLQTQRLGKMKRVLAKRDYLLIQYLKLKSSFITNKEFSKQVDSLSEILVNSKPSSDSSIRTTQKKITTTVYQAPLAKKQSFFSKLFSKRKKDITADNVNKDKLEIKEEIHVTIDTLAVAKQDSAIRKVGRMMKVLEKDQRQQSHKRLARELALVKSNIELINQLLSILREVENQEIVSTERRDGEAAEMVNSSIQRIGIIIVIFFLVAALFVFLILIDISKSNYYRNQLIEAKEQTEELSKIKQRFFANMSHEIRTPLQSIIGYLELLEKNKNNKEAMRAIQNSSEHLLHIVNELLDFSRIESDTFSLKKSPFDLTQLVSEVASVIRVQAEVKHLQFITEDFPGSELKLVGDAFRLRQILYNLLSNAIKFTQRGHVIFKTEIIEQEKVKCTFKIIDTGCGIDEKNLQTIFARFEQGNENIYQQHEGVGLGLSIVKKLVDLQHGTIDVKSTLGHGTQFAVTLAFEKSNRGELALDDSIIQPIPKKEGTVIVVDDDPLILRLCELNLLNHSVSFKTFQRSEEILKEDLKEVDYIFLDIRMPGINGMELCKIIRPKTKAKIIALTAQALAAQQDALLQMGFDFILAKPFRQSEFFKILGFNTDSTEGTLNDIDLSSLRKMTMNDDDFFYSVISQFIDETKADIGQLENNRLSENILVVSDVVHKLAGRTGQMGLREISETFRHIEIKLNSGETVTERLRQEISEALTLLKLAIGSLQKEKDDVAR